MGKELIIGDQAVHIREEPLGDFISLTDLAKLVHKDSSRVISKWIEMLKTIEYLKTWEEQFNPDFDKAAYQGIRLQAGVPNFYLSAKQWIKQTNAIGITAESGRYGGTFAHHLIALEFCTSMSPEFRLQVYKEYIDMKQNQVERWLKAQAFFLRKIEDNSMENNRLAIEIQEEIKRLKK